MIGVDRNLELSIQLLLAIPVSMENECFKLIPSTLLMSLKYSFSVLNINITNTMIDIFNFLKTSTSKKIRPKILRKTQFSLHQLKINLSCKLIRTKTKQKKPY